MSALARLAGCTVLVFGVWSLTASPSLQAQDKKDKKETPEVKEAREAILKLADLASKPEELKKQAAAVAAKKMDLEDIMTVFKPREKHGVGVGKPKEITPDGIEQKIIALGKNRPMAKMDLTKQGPALVRMGEITLAIGEVAEHYAPKERKGDKDPKEWKRTNDDMLKFSKALIEAAKKEDPAALKAAAQSLNNSCAACHAKFRDND
jgi:hypothetical protein